MLEREFMGAMIGAGIFARLGEAGTIARSGPPPRLKQ